ncbi:MAG: FadR/GntR family transcriptional regulator [Rhodococcus sp. (in: high G+C Gram-positive bacteria)]|uniref:FadR/GntR family transcriptional regulator n=1 Tax=Rhodococcus sp. TaxID=1831 RepID=UPI003BAF0DDB
MAEGYSFAAKSGHYRVRPLKMSDQVAQQIRRMIARGELQDGDWLPPEPALMEQFGVSRPTLREAFRLLEGDSLVTIRRGPPGGARVTVPGPDAAADLFGLLLTLAGTAVADVWDARMVIEPHAVRLLTLSATPVELQALDGAIEHLRSVFDNPPAFSSAAAQFHVQLVELSGSRTLAAVIGMLSEIVERELAQHLEGKDPDNDAIRKANRRALRGYEKIVELIRAGDADEAEKAWRTHMNSARRYLGSTKDSARLVDLLY